MRLDISHTTPLFGPAAAVYGPIVRDVIPRLRNVTYRFYDNESVLQSVKLGHIGAAEVNAVVVGELLVSAHLAAVTSIIRSCRWMEATWREYEADNLLGWAACCRSLLEAVGDTVHSLGSIPTSLAENQAILRQGISGYDEKIISTEELERELLHFSHARKLSKSEKQTENPAHVARQTTEYIQVLEKAGLAGSAQLYSELCQIGHPARASLSWLYSAAEGGFTVDERRDKDEIQVLAKRHKEVLSDLPSVAFNPGLLILRVLVRFRMFPIVPELKRFNFAGAIAWRKIEPLLRS